MSFHRPQLRLQQKKEEEQTTQKADNLRRGVHKPAHSQTLIHLIKFECHMLKFVCYICINKTFDNMYALKVHVYINKRANNMRIVELLFI